MSKQQNVGSGRLGEDYSMQDLLNASKMTDKDVPLSGIQQPTLFDSAAAEQTQKRNVTGGATGSSDPRFQPSVQADSDPSQPMGGPPPMGGLQKTDAMSHHGGMPGMPSGDKY